jgi:ribosomal-protein-alanine N-acetyltransferase
MPQIQTDRLDLLALTQAQLKLCLEAPDQLARDLGCPIAQGVITDVVRRAIRIKLAKMEPVDPRHHSWYTYWLIVLRAGPCGAGLAGFKGRPDIAGTYDKAGEVEIGYGIAPDYQQQGYMTEAVRAMIAWAFEQPGCHAVIAPHTLKSNIASNRVLEKVGMTVYDETDKALSWRIEKA